MGFGLDQLGWPFFSFLIEERVELDEVDESQPFVSSYGCPIFFHIVVSHQDFDKVPTRTNNGTKQTTEIVLELS